MEGSGIRPGLLRKRSERAAGWVERARRSDGYERHMLLLVAKSALAATLAWGVSHDLMAAAAPAFAPFSAVLMMQVTVYQSVVQSLRHLVAVAAGVLLQGLLALTLGPGLPAFALTALVALSLSQWPRLGSQGLQVSTAAFFAFSLYVMSTGVTVRFGQLGQVLLLVLIGCVIGVAVNVLVYPPLRYRRAEDGIRVACRSMTGLFDDVADGVREIELGSEQTAKWRRLAGDLEKTVAQARTSVATARESVWYNPRRSARRQRRSGFSVHSALVEALDRVSHQFVSVTRCLDLWYAETDQAPYADFLREYADFLAGAARTADALGDISTGPADHRRSTLRELVERTEECRRKLEAGAEQSGLPLADHSRPYGVLLLEATRIAEEFSYAWEILNLSEGGDGSDEEPKARERGADDGDDAPATRVRERPHGGSGRRA